MMAYMAVIDRADGAIPRRLLDSPPYAAVLYAVPVYWHQWQALFAARPKKMEFVERTGEEKS